MNLKGVLHKIAWVNLETKDVYGQKIEEPADEVYTKYLGGYGNSMLSMRQQLIYALPCSLGQVSAKPKEP